MNKWPMVRLDECCAVVSGGTPKTGIAGYWGDEIYWATPTDLGKLRGKLIGDTPRKLSSDGLQSCSAAILPVGSVLLSSRAPIGHVAINTVPMATNQGFKSLVPRRDRVNSSYLYYWLRMHRSYLESLGSGATFKEISKTAVSRIEIPLPSIEEQERIADRLDQADSLLAKRRRTIPLLDELTQSVFLDMFGDPLSNPRSWPLRAMGELFRAKPCYGTMIPASKGAGEWSCLRVANIQDWELDLRDEKFVDLDPSDVDRHSVIDGDMVFARAIAPEEHLGKSVITYPGNKRWAFDSHLMRLRFNREKVVPEFVREALRTPGGRKLFLSVTRRSAVQYNINTKEIGGLCIPVPALDLQRKYLERVQHIKDLRNAADSALEGLDELYVSLQTRAFRGEL